MSTSSSSPSCGPSPRACSTLYAATGRILPVNYKFDRDALVYYSDAVERCEETNFGTKSNPIWGRLPTKEEAKYLAPLVGFGSLDWSGADIRHRIWYKGSNDQGCASGDASVLVRDPRLQRHGVRVRRRQLLG